jgi:hypothetical protein
MQLMVAFDGRLSKTGAMLPPLGPQGLSIAEALEWLRLSMPPARRCLRWWSDMDYPLAGAHLVDLSFQGVVDTDLHSVIRAPLHTSRHAKSTMLTLLEAQDGVAPLDVAIEAIVSRIGDLRAAIRETLQAKGIVRRETEPLIWGFVQLRTSPGAAPKAAGLRAALTGLIEGEELPSPEEAALISLLHASGMIAEMLGVPKPRAWLARHETRIAAIHRMDLVGQTVSATVTAMRARLAAYLLRPEAGMKGHAGAGWEWRCFWPGEASIALPPPLDLAGKGVEEPEEAAADTYLFLHGKRDNIKFRGKGLKVKPVIEAFDEFSAFGSSRKVAFPVRAERLMEIFPRFNEIEVKLRTREDMLAALSASGYRPGVVTVQKARREYRAILGVKIELARLEVQGRVFHSLSLESRFLTALRVLCRNVPVGDGIVAGYAAFLERMALGRA